MSASCHKRTTSATLRSAVIGVDTAPSLYREMHDGDAAGSIVGHVARNRLTFLRPHRARQRRLALELGFEDAEIWRLAGTQGLHIESIAACLYARYLARERQVLLDVIFSEMSGVLGLIVENEELVH